jgi:hypothetical protein
LSDQHPMDNLKKVCEGFVYAGFNVDSADGAASPGHSCIVCGNACTTDLKAVVVSDKNKLQTWQFSRVHPQCFPWTPAERSKWITRPYDTLACYRGLAMICRAFTAQGYKININKISCGSQRLCFICKKLIGGGMYFTEVGISTTFACAFLHQGCAEPFEKEWKSAVLACERTCM